MTLEKYFKHHFNNPNYLYFFVSLILMLVIPALAPYVVFGRLLMEIMYALVILLACVYTSRSYRDLRLFGLIGIVSYALFILFDQFNVASIFLPITTGLFFGLVLIRLIQYVLEPRRMEVNDILALCSGYIVLGVMATTFFSVLDLQLEHAFSFEQDAEFYDLMYFSFITLTSVGYGDIVPMHPMARSIVLLLAILGQLYLAILVGIIIGKYISSNNISSSQ